MKRGSVIGSATGESPVDEDEVADAFPIREHAGGRHSQLTRERTDVHQSHDGRVIECKGCPRDPRRVAEELRNTPALTP